MSAHGTSRDVFSRAREIHCTSAIRARARAKKRSRGWVRGVGPSGAPRACSLLFTFNRICIPGGLPLFRARAKFIAKAQFARAHKQKSPPAEIISK